MDKRLVIIGGLVTAGLGIASYLFIGIQATVFAGFGGGLAVGIQSGHWNDEVIMGAFGSALGAILLLIAYTAILALQTVLNLTDVTITLAIAGTTYGYLYFLLAIIPFLIEGAIGGYIGRWAGKRAKLTPGYR